MKTRLAEASFALMLSAGAVFADTVDADALVINLGAGVTNTIAEALQAIDPSYTTAMLNGGDLKDRQIVKNGEGTLKFDTAISGYAGRIFIREGVAVCNVQYGLGTGSNGSAASGTEVAAGATLVMDSSAQTAAWTAVEKERIAFAGSGYAGHGAIYAINNQYNSTWATGSCPILTGDATMKISSPVQASSSAAFGTENGETVDLNGNTLTLVGLTSHWNKPWFNIFKSSVTPGHLLVSNAVLMVQADAVFQGGAGNTLTLGKDAIFRPSLTTGDSRFPWTLVSDDPRALMFSRAVTTYQILGDGAGIPNVNRWDGPVRLDNNLPLCRADNASVRHNWAFAGKVSGEGGFSMTEQVAYDPPNYTTNINLHLSNPLNDFAGGVSLGDNWNLYLYENGALPSAGGGVSMLNGALHLLSTNAYELPSASFESTAAARFSRVLGGKGRWIGSVVKTGPESLGYYSAVGGPLLDVRAGSVKFAKRHAGMLVYKTTNNWSGASAYCNNAFGREDPYQPGDLAYFEPFALTVSASPFFSSSVWRKYSAWRCLGYIVNDGDDASWTFAVGASHGQRILLDGVEILKQYQFSNPCVYKPSTVTVPVSHGAHVFEVRTIARSDSLTTTPSANEGFALYDKVDAEGSITNWYARTEWCGLLVDRQGRGSRNYYDYEPLLDPGDGSVFLATTNAAENAAFVPAFDKLKFAAGTSLDLNGHDYTMNDLEGFPSVAGGNLCITGRWSVAASALQGGSSMTVAGDVTFGPNATIDITGLEGVQMPATIDVVSAAGTVSGAPAVTVDGQSSKRWVATASGNKLKLAKNGLFLIFR